MPDEDTLTSCLRAIAAGRSIGIFPEGKANADPRFLLRGRNGVGHLVLQTGVEVVPIGIDFERRPERERVPALGKIILRVGARLRFVGSRRVFRGRKQRTLRRRAAAAVDLIMRNLAVLSGKAYPFREPAGGRLSVDYHMVQL